MQTDNKVNQKTHKFVVRLPMQLRNRLADAAKYYRRSMNSEIVARLEHSFIGLPQQNSEAAHAPQNHFELNAFFSPDLTDDEETILRGYRSLPKEKKHALLELLA